MDEVVCVRLHVSRGLSSTDDLILNVCIIPTIAMTEGHCTTFKKSNRAIHINPLFKMAFNGLFLLCLGIYQ